MKINLYPQSKTLEAEFEAHLAAHQAVLSSFFSQDFKRKHQDNLGWLDLTKLRLEANIPAIKRFASRIQTDFDYLILIGVGGSINAARAAIACLNPESPCQVVYAGNHLSAFEIRQMLDLVQNHKVHLHCIAKNFETLEPGLSFRLLRQALEQKYGANTAAYISATGTKGGQLEALCKEQGWPFFQFPLDVGGRFSALTVVGLLPMAVAGIDIDALLDGARTCQLNLQQDPTVTNPALGYAVLRHFLYQAGYGIELLTSFEPRLYHFSKWWLQLFGESEGKEGKGLFPAIAAYSEDLHAIGQYVQEGKSQLFETILTVLEPDIDLTIHESQIDDGFSYLDGQSLVDINKKAQAATIGAHSQTLPFVVEICMDRLDAHHLGQAFYFFQWAVTLSAILLDLNPFDQPGVEAYKEGMFEALGKIKP